jgi:hypothetical protein
MPQAQAPAFSKDDQLRMARERCGAAERGTAIGDIGGTPETLSGFLTADGETFYVELLSETYEEQRVGRHVIAFGGHQMAEEGKIFTGQPVRPSSAWECSNRAAAPGA